MRLLKFIFSAALVFGTVDWPMQAVAQNANARVVASCGSMAPFSNQHAGSNGNQTVDPNGNGCTAASVSASITGFPGSAQSTGTPIAVTNVSTTGTLPAGAVVVAYNVGTTNTAFCKLGASATTSDQAIAPNSWFSFTVGSATQLSCITASSTTTVNMVGGSGLPTGAGGGGGGSGGSTPPVTPVATAALAANLVLSATAANLHSFNVSADSTLSAAAWWVMIYNAASAPADGAVTPIKCYALTSGTTSVGGAFVAPVAFSTGIVIGVSTTGCFTKTASTHAFISAE